MITPEQLKDVLKEHRWTLSFSNSGRQQAFSAKQRRGKKLATCYIGTSHTLNKLTENDVVEKINRKAAEDEERLARKLDGNGQAHCPTRNAGKNKYNLPQFQTQQAGG